MARWLLDTNIVSDAARNPQGQLAGRLASLSDEDLCISVVVAGELRYGLRKRDSAKLTASVEAVLGGLTIEPLGPAAADIYGDLRATLERRGEPMDGNDLWIAAHALSLGCVLVTNDGAFERVPGLDVENWLKPDTA
jgi:tRNA(fMet)-specific endonuclease VapC